MESYIIPETCVICSNDTIICPLSYKCGHEFCMSCIYLNRTNELFKKCPICRIDDESRCDINSPIYKLNENVNYVNFYSHFFRNPMKRIEPIELENAIGTYIVAHITQYIPDKDITENISYIGICAMIYVPISGCIGVTIDKCYYLNRTFHHIYSTTPISRSILVTSDVTIYTKE